MVEYTLKRSRRRKTVALKVQQQSLTVYAPYGVAVASIEHWLQSKQEWIKLQITQQGQLIQQQQQPMQAMQINLFGSPLTLSFATGKKTLVHFVDEAMLPNLHITISTRVQNKQAMYQTQLETFLHDQLESYIEMRLHHFCDQMGEALPSKLKIMVYKRRWGSCNQRRELTFNLLLVSAPQWIIDYVIVHELSHLKYLNHSSQFWSRVNQYYPQYKDASSWLEKNGASLQWKFE
ncbi:M48 family metallopeptidase [Pseudoalteromonas sp. H105]|uniref:M48 family metallopeptidase n=1 Tax=Pseudoalteromonas sp. H105 TaxID=1348393 RepID=UPI00073218B2|nr:YgjP-like metallopeptidase domain-containing protein [Pseudoalteromonas sp. H105]KTF14709.1 hypothetical protein ATS75_11210 [Pseudoalteromonas sp. H105]